jgi:hypothetical protein
MSNLEIGARFKELAEKLERNQNNKKFCELVNNKINKLEKKVRG